MKQKVVGTFCLGREYVQVVLREGTGADYWLMPEHGAIPRIKVGVDGTWGNVIGWLTHEVMELTLDRLSCRLDPTNDLGSDHAAYVFVVPHVQFSDACMRVGIFLDETLPTLAKEWKKWKKERREA